MASQRSAAVGEHDCLGCRRTAHSNSTCQCHSQCLGKHLHTQKSNIARQAQVCPLLYSAGGENSKGAQICFR